MMKLDADTLVPMMAMVIPIVAIVGGITAGIVRTIGQQRLIELAHKERIAAIERGIDPAKLPPIPSIDYGDNYGRGPSSPKRRAQGLLIGGLVTLSIGLSLSFMLQHAEPGHTHWVVGVLPTAIGIALLVSAWIVWPRDTTPKA